MSLSLYGSISERISAILYEASPSLDPERTTHLQDTIAVNAPIDFEQSADHFAHAYWLRNYWKTVYFFEYECRYTHPVQWVTSLGAGSAADTLACMVWLNQNAQEGSAICLSLVDKSPRQLTLAKQLIETALPLLNRVRWHITYHETSIETWHGEKHAADIILMGYLLTENTPQVEALCAKATRHLRAGGTIAIIERECDSVWQHAIRALHNQGVCVFDADISTIKLAQLHSHLPFDDKNITPHFVAASKPVLDYQADLIRRYFVAWRTQSSDMLKNIYTEDAVYYEKPGVEEKIDGLKNIIEYWKEFPMQQRNIDVHLRSVAHQGNLTVCAFEGEFDTTKQHIAIRGAINFYTDPHSKKIRKLTEYFGTQKTPFR